MVIFHAMVQKMITSAMEIRQKSDYEDFYVVSKSDAVKQIENAEYIVELIAEYLKPVIGGQAGGAN